MNHQITLEELGIISKLQQSKRTEQCINYACPCGGCLCNHCANSVECFDNCTGEAEFACFTCDECRRYDGRGSDRWKSECSNYKVTNRFAEYMRGRFKTI